MCALLAGDDEALAAKDDKKACGCVDTYKAPINVLLNSAMTNLNDVKVLVAQCADGTLATSPRASDGLATSPSFLLVAALSITLLGMHYPLE